MIDVRVTSSALHTNYAPCYLADTLGNFVNRGIMFVSKYFDGRVPPAQADGEPEREVKAALAAAVRDGREAMDSYQLGKAVRAMRPGVVECSISCAASPWPKRK